MHPEHGKGLTFSEALEQLKDGRKLQRQSWDGKDQWVVRQVGYPQGITLNHNTAQATGLPEGSTQVFEPYFMMYTPWSTFVPWTPSTTDLNADDWEVYYMPGEYERLCQEETDAVLADPETVADLEEAGLDLATYSHAEVKMVVALRALEREDLPGREDIRFRLVRQLLRPVIDQRRQIDGEIADIGGMPPGVAETIHAFVGVITKLNEDLTQTKLVLDSAHGKLDKLEAERGINVFGEEPSFDRLMTVLKSTVDVWRSNFTDEERTDGWAFTVNGRRVDGVDKVTSTEMVVRELPTLEQEERMLAFIADVRDPEATQQLSRINPDNPALIQPGDPDYPERPQRLADQFRLRATFEPTDGSDRNAPRQIRRAAPDAEPGDTVTVLAREPKYFLTLPGCDEVEVTKEVWVNAERHAGFRPKGEDVGQPATSGFSSTVTNSSGRVEYHPQ